MLQQKKLLETRFNEGICKQCGAMIGADYPIKKGYIIGNVKLCSDCYKEIPKDYISCDACSIRIGVNYLVKDFEQVGDVKLCHVCFRTLEKRKFLRLEDTENKANTILQDGRILYIDIKELQEYVNSICKKHPDCQEKHQICSSD